MIEYNPIEVVLRNELMGCDLQKYSLKGWLTFEPTGRLAPFRYKDEIEAEGRKPSGANERTPDGLRRSATTG